MAFRFLLISLITAPVLFAAPRKRPDKKVTYYFDLTREGDKKPAILALTLPRRFWQHSDHPPSWAPGTAVRTGWGTAWFCAEDYYDSGCQAHVLLEFAEMGKRSLSKATKEHNTTLAEICKQSRTGLKSTPSKPKLFKKLRLAKKRVKAYTVRYNVTPQGVSGVVDPATALLFEVNGYLVTLTVVKWGRTDYFDEIVAGLHRASSAVPKRAPPFKLLDLTEGVSKYITMDGPPGFRRVYRYKHGRPDAVFERRGADGRTRTRLTLKNTFLDGKTLEGWVKARVSAYKDHYDKVGEPAKVKVGDRDGILVEFSDDSREEVAEVRRVRAVFFKLHRQVWTIRIETMGDDAARIKADGALLADLLASAQTWRAQLK